jgi:hypothetical protein
LIDARVGYSLLKVKMLFGPSERARRVTGKPEGNPDVVYDIKPSSANSIMLQKGLTAIGVDGTQHRAIGFD